MRAAKPTRVVAGQHVAVGPDVAGAAAVAREEDVFGVVQVGVGRALDALNNARLQVHQHRPRNVVLVVGLLGGRKKKKKKKKKNKKQGI